MTAYEPKPIPAEILKIGQSKKLSPGQKAFTAGDPYQGPYLVKSGFCKVYSVEQPPNLSAKTKKETAEPDHLKETILHVFAPGEPMAVMPMVKNTGHYPANCCAMNHAEVLLFPIEELRALIEQSPELEKFFTHGAITLMDSIRKIIQIRGSMAAKERVYHYFITFADAQTKSLDLKIPKNVLAAWLNLTPESLSRSLKQLKDAGLLTVSGKTYTVNNPE